MKEPIVAPDYTDEELLEANEAEESFEDAERQDLPPPKTTRPYREAPSRVVVLEPERHHAVFSDDQLIVYHIDSPLAKVMPYFDPRILTDEQLRHKIRLMLLLQ